MSAPRRGRVYTLAPVVVADPPWTYGDTIDAANGRRGAATQYGTMSLPAILGCFGPACEEAGVRIAADALLFCWFTNAFAVEAHAVARRWGFEPKTIVTWIKGRLAVAEDDYNIERGKAPTVRDEVKRTAAIGHHGRITPRLIQQVGQGHYFRNSTEHVLVAARGRAMIAAARRVPTAFVAPRPRETRPVGDKARSMAVHSAKPAAFSAIVEAVADGPYFELFSRRDRPGWIAWGHETGVLNEVEAAC